jgi:hypothetical protein
VATIKNNTQRNVALELLEIFRRFGVSHLKFVASKFESKLAKYGEYLSSFFFTNSDEPQLTQFDSLI